MLPEGDVASWAWKLRVRVQRRFSRKPRQDRLDDFDWDRYHREYRTQLSLQEPDVLLRLEAGDYRWRGDRLVRESTSRAELHPNHQLLYETVAMLRPSTVLEVGCGGGDHLHNLRVLLPDLDVRGIDRSPGQLATLAERNPEVLDRTSIFNLVADDPQSIESADVVFSQAVIMHIQTGSAHLTALEAMFKLANHQVVLVENWARHDFVADIFNLMAQGRIDWPALHLHMRDSGEGARRATCLIASRRALPWRGVSASADLFVT